MMKVEQIKTPDDIERYIEGCLNDFETAISTKDETLVFLAELVVHVYKEAKKEQCNIADVVGRTEQLVICKKCGSSEMYQYTKTKDKCEDCGNIQDY